jgi:predicted nuclease of predicted toxin-antitoxin system
MRILFDNNTPRPLRRFLTEHIVDTARERGWAEVSNGNLLDKAERDGYEILITGDQNMSYQQNIGHRQIAVIVLLSNRWPDVQLRSEEIRAALEAIKPGEFREVSI